MVRYTSRGNGIRIFISINSQLAHDFPLLLSLLEAYIALSEYAKDIERYNEIKSMDERQET